MDFLKDFGVQPILLAAQIVNFLILLFILKRLLYRPILKVLDERKQKIAESLKNADEIEKRLQSIIEEREKKLIEANKEVKEVLVEAGKNADQIVKEAHKKAEEDIKKFTEKAYASLQLEKEKLHQEIKAELVDMVILGLKKVAGKTLNEKDKKELVEKSLNNLS